MSQTLATMLTMTTYGSWLRGDARGWVDRGIIWPANPRLERADQGRLKHPPFRFKRRDLDRVGAAIGQSLNERLGVCLEQLAISLGCRCHTPLLLTACKQAVPPG